MKSGPKRAPGARKKTTWGLKMGGEGWEALLFSDHLQVTVFLKVPDAGSKHQGDDVRFW